MSQKLALCYRMVQGSCGTLWFINDAALASIKWQISLKTGGLQDIFNRIETKFKVNLVQIWPTRDNLGQWLSKSTYKVSLVQIATLYTVSTVSESSAMFTIGFAHGYEHNTGRGIWSQTWGWVENYLGCSTILPCATPIQASPFTVKVLGQQKSVTVAQVSL